MIRLIRAEDHRTVSEAAAAWVSAEVRKKPESVICLAAGRTHLLMYSMLLDMSRASLVSFKSCTFFAMDEYLGLGHDSPHSLRHMLEQSFVLGTGVDSSRFRYLDSLASDPEAEAARYEREIMEAGGLDIAILGIGRNGHIGFNEPGSAFTSRTRVVDLTKETIEQNACQFGGTHKVPTRAFTMGVATLMQARKVLLVASGRDKAQALYNVLVSRPCIDVPASALRLHPDATIVADRESLYGLDSQVPAGASLV